MNTKPPDWMLDLTDGQKASVLAGHDYRCPPHLIREFERGCVPCDSPTGLEERAYLLWQTCGGVVRPGAEKEAIARTELQQFVAMLNRSFVGHGLRHDHNPKGTAVQVENQDGDNDVIAEFWFDEAGTLKTTHFYEAEEG